MSKFLKTTNMKVLKEIYKYENSLIDDFSTNDIVHKKKGYFKGKSVKRNP